MPLAAIRLRQSRNCRQPVCRSANHIRYRKHRRQPATGKDYGKVHWFASPLFWLLNQLHNIIGNWGWAIVVLTIIVKAVLYPLTNASYRSMAKMRAAAPKLQTIKENTATTVWRNSKR